MNYPPTCSVPGSIRHELTQALTQEAQRLATGKPTDDDEQARLTMLIDLWKSGFRGLAPARLRPEVLQEAEAVLR